MKNPFSKSSNLSALRDITSTFAIITEFQRRGLLHWQRKEKALLLEQSLATIALSQGAEKFRLFLDQICLWQDYVLLQETYESHRINIEAKAVREAKQKYHNLTEADLKRIRQDARDNMQPISDDDIESLRIREFDLYILRANAPSAQAAAESLSEHDRTDTPASLVALGHYDGNSLEMALYDDIRHNLHQ